MNGFVLKDVKGSAHYRIGIDVGGTFTDLVLLNEKTGEIFSHKVSSTPTMPHKAPIQGIKELFEKHDLIGHEVSFIGLGTTVATNAFLENKIARTALITTRGFKDLLEIARQQRPGVYDPFKQKVAAPVAADLRFEVDERIDAAGEILTALDEQQLRDALLQAREQGVECVAVCFLNAYANPVHEVRAVELGKEIWPQGHIVSSSEIIREFREYERFLTTVINVSLGPLLHDYFMQFQNEVQQMGIEVDALIMNSSGGVVPCENAGDRAVDTLFSGPSGGVSSAVYMGQIMGRSDLITFDMGGTSTEVCAIQGLKPQRVFARTINSYPIKVAAYDIHTIGAGGSSIATIDEGGSLSVGPFSAGANPGPACYRLGGQSATVTDANVVLGRLNQDYLLAGSLKIDSAQSRECIIREVGHPRGVCDVLAALSIVALAEANMAQAIRVVSVEKGLDPSGFSLIALGGAGPLHAASVAREVGMREVVIPRNAGVFCALGVLTKDIQVSQSRSVLISDDGHNAYADIERLFIALERRAADALLAQGYSQIDFVFNWHADVRYQGQNHEITIDIPRESFSADVIDRIRGTFHDAHEELFGYRLMDNAISFVTLRLDASVPIPRPLIDRQEESDRESLPEAAAYRKVHFDEAHVAECPVYQRDDLHCGIQLAGPAIIEQMDSTTIIPPGFVARIDSWQNIIINW